jgi:hypothetical protein
MRITVKKKQIINLAFILSLMDGRRKLLKFKTMKKQVLFLTMFTLALIFASTTNVFAQDILTGAPTCLTPVPLDPTCQGNHLEPSPGTPYLYTVNVANLSNLTGTQAANITWVVTTSQTFIDATGFVATPDPADGSGYIASVGATGTAHNTSTAVDGSGNSSIEITWNAFTHDAANPVFLVAYATDAGGVCLSDNMDAWIIQPKHSFTVDIENLAIDGTSQADAYATCVAPVAEAIYNTVTSTIDFDYGVNYMYFQVNAANFSGSWQPSFQVGGTAFSGSRVATAVDWQYISDATTNTWNSMTDAGAGLWTTTGAVNAVAASGAVGDAGECIIVRVTLDNNQDETVAAEIVSLAVNGTMEDPAAAGDYSNTDYDVIDAATCLAADFDDSVTQELSPRPDVVEVSPAPASFVPDNRN